jgi:hypothetical protein
VEIHCPARCARDQNLLNSSGRASTAWIKHLITLAVGLLVLQPAHQNPQRNEQARGEVKTQYVDFLIAMNGEDSYGETMRFAWSLQRVPASQISLTAPRLHRLHIGPGPRSMFQDAENL